MRAFGLPRLVGFYLVMLAIALGAIAWHGQLASVVPALDLRAWGIGLGLGVGVGGLMVVVSRLLAARFRWARQLSEEFRSALGELSHREVLLVAVLSSLGEEALFRGLLQPALGLWIAAAIFAVLHVGPGLRFAPWTVMAFGAGLLFGVMFAWSGYLLAPIAAHFVVNYLNLRHLTARVPGVELELGVPGGEHLARP